jgi:cardiolipin synthase
MSHAPPWISVSALLVLAVVVLDLYAIGRAVMRGRGVDRTLTWVFAILALPGLGAAAYLLVANPSVGKTIQRKRIARDVIRRTVGERLGQLELPSSEAGSILRLATSATGLPPSIGNSVELLATDDGAFERIEAALRAAKRFIWAEYYLIGDDETGHRFLEVLATKAAEGIDVRLLYDAVGSMHLDAKRLRAIEAAGGRVAAFLPVNPLRRRWTVLLRNHRKMIMIDGELGFAGGMNIGDQYSGRSRRRGARYFRDSHLGLRGPVVTDLTQVFCEDWWFATEELLELPPPSPIEGGTSVVALVPSGPDQEHNASGLVYFAGIASARERCYLTSPYFIPDEAVARALVSAAMRGVDVRVLVPERCDVRIAGAAARSYYPGLVRSGVRIFEYRPSMLHTKTMVVDGAWSIVGSANVDMRSFGLNFELGALVVDPRFARGLEARFLRELADSTEMTSSDLAARRFSQRLAQTTARLLSPLL